MVEKHRPRPGDKVWSMWELSEAGALREERKERERLRGEQRPGGFSGQPPTSEGSCYGLPGRGVTPEAALWSLDLGLGSTRQRGLSGTKFRASGPREFLEPVRRFRRGAGVMERVD